MNGTISRSWGWIAIVFAPFLIGCQQEYLRGYTAGYNRSDDSCKEFKRLDQIICRDDMAELATNLKICQSILASTKAVKK